MASINPPRIQFKRSITPGAVPSPGDLLVGEIAINLYDQIIYTKNDSDEIISIGGGNTEGLDSDLSNLGLNDLLDVDLTTIVPKHGHVLTYDSDAETWVSTFSETITELRRETAFATDGQNAFVLLHEPTGAVQVARNAMVLNSNATYLDSDGVTVIYVPANNNNREMEDGDQMDFTYNVSITSIIPAFEIDGGGA
jgi:hypothetical protein